KKMALQSDKESESEGNNSPTEILGKNRVTSYKHQDTKCLFKNKEMMPSLMNDKSSNDERISLEADSEENSDGDKPDLPQNLLKVLKQYNLHALLGNPVPKVKKDIKELDLKSTASLDDVNEGDDVEEDVFKALSEDKNNDVDGPLRGMLDFLPPFEWCSNIAYTNGAAFSRLGNIIAQDETGKSIYDFVILKCLVSVVTFTQFPDSYMINPARVSYKDYEMVIMGYSKSKCIGKKGEILDNIIFGITAQDSSAVSEAEDMRSGKVQKSLCFYPITGEGQHAATFFYEVLYKHLDNDEPVSIHTDGGAWTVTTLTLTPKNYSSDKRASSGKAKASRVQHRVVDPGSPDKARRHSHKGIAEALDCHVHFPNEDVFLEKNKQRLFNVQDILTQYSNEDPGWEGEIPTDSYVAVHTLPNAYSDQAGDYIRFNIIGIQILLTPSDD
ncbi:hypothetical protein K488DRAFT_75311, partial [Vararia minispora EC-137]